MSSPKEKNKASITVFTPAYNRAYTLHKCYESLCKQKNKCFEWMIIDDGSTDNTREIVEQWKNSNNDLVIRYLYKENGGMHTAHNLAYENIQTELNVCIDSDDYLADNAIEKILQTWEKVKEDKKISGIIALDCFENGEIVGTRLPDKEYITLKDFYKEGGKGDKKLIYRTEVMREFPPYPEFAGEKYVGLAYKYYQADQKYKLKILNEPVCVVEYMEDGSSNNMFKQYLKNPRGFAFFRVECMKLAEGFGENFRNCIHYVSSSIIAKNSKFLKESPKKIETVLAIPFGILLTIYIKVKAGKQI